MTAVRKWGPWVLLLAVAVGGLAFGLQRHDHPTLDARVSHIAGLVRCPVCNGESAAVSQSAPAVEMRAEIRKDLLAGQSQAQILQSMVDSYGASILEQPQASGVGLVVWVVPVVAFVVGLGGLGLLFARWKRRAGDSDSAGDSDTGGDGPGAVEEGWDLDEAEGEADAPLAVAVGARSVAAVGSRSPVGGGSGSGSVAGSGGAGPAGAEAGAVEAPGVEPVSGGRPRRLRSRRTLAAVAGIVVAAGAASWAMASSSGTRLAGQEITGQSVGLSTGELATELQAADQDAAKNQPLAAIKQYEKILKVDPNQVEALTGEGWLLAETQQPTLLQQGVSMLARAEKVNPSYAPAHVYRGIALLSEDDYSASVPELQWYLAHNPDPQLTVEVRKALAQAQAGLARQNPPGGKG